MAQLLQFTERGIYCETGDFYIDPTKKVERAVISHAHSDHARGGHGSYLAHRLSAPTLKHRLGKNLNISTLDYGEKTDINGVSISLYPAAHVVGSAQVRVEYKGEVWVVSGDYKLEDDGVSGIFEPVKCHTFVTESTFASPEYSWQPQSEAFAEIAEWWRGNIASGRLTILAGYSLGKAQRITKNLDYSIGDVYMHPTIYDQNEVLIEAGVDLPRLQRLNTSSWRKWRQDSRIWDRLKSSLIIIPPGEMNSSWLKSLFPYSVGYCSGWVQTRRWMNPKIDKGFVISDHADWIGINQTVDATSASKVYTMHGFEQKLADWLNSRGIEAETVTPRIKGNSRKFKGVSAQQYDIWG